MIVRILSNGTSFKGCADYLAHDVERAKTAERVAWTHTHNLANDDVSCAVNEMVWTARDGELLKQQAGIRPGGRETENTVKHFSLNWSPEDKPTREHMIATTEDFLRHMGWAEHQAIFFSHTDKPYAHVHVMLNAVHPENGLRLDDDYEHERAQKWALEYERANGRIYCEQRLLNADAREKAMPRNIWMAFKDNERDFGNSEKLLRENDSIILDDEKIRKNSEWEILKENQKAERIAFFNAGKSEFKELRNSIYREIREEFRERWCDFYALGKNGADAETLAATKAKLVAEQKAELDTRRDNACAELRVDRDERYETLLHDQKAVRAELKWRQELGLDNAAFLSEAESRDTESDIRAGFRNAANELTRSPGYETTRKEADATAEQPREQRGRGGDDIGPRFGFGIGSLFEALCTQLINLGSAPKTPVRANTDAFHAAAEETAKRERYERDEEEAAKRDKERSVSWG